MHGVYAGERDINLLHHLRLTKLSVDAFENEEPTL